jgi:hypothetical protein
MKIRNVNRTVGTMLSSELTPPQAGVHGRLPEDTIWIDCKARPARASARSPSGA